MKAALYSDAGQTDLLLWLKLNIFRHKLREAVVRSPLKTAVSVLTLLLIWTGIYVLFDWIFSVVGRDRLAGPVAIRYVLDFFLLALTLMLMFSAGLLSYTGLFRGREVEYLLATPLRSRPIVLIKYVESLILASWSLILLGVPLMVAYGSVRNQGFAFAITAVAFFVAFVAIPGAWGAILAVLLARFTTRHWRINLLYLLLPVAGLGIFLAARAWADFQGDYQRWLSLIFDNIRLVRGQVYPSTWVAKGISAAANQNWSQAGFYLWITVANALFFSMLAIELTRKLLPSAYARVQSGRTVRWASIFDGYYSKLLPRLTGWQCGAMMLKDLACFIRDPVQWGQFAIVLALLMLYIFNAPKLPLEMRGPHFQHLMSFLNLTAVSLLMASFTSRFVYPLVSLEVRTTWLLCCLQDGRAKLVRWKFLFAFLITGICTAAIMAFTIGQVKLPAVWSIMSITMAIAICAGLSAIAVGFGARFAAAGDRHADIARLASSGPGTISLIAAMLYIAAMLAVVGLLSLRSLALGPQWSMPTLMWLAWPASIVATFAAVIAILTWGTRHFQKAQL